MRGMGISVSNTFARTHGRSTGLFHFGTVRQTSAAVPVKETQRLA